MRDVNKPAIKLIEQINRALQGKDVYEARIGDYALRKHMRITQTELDNMNEEQVLFDKIMMRRELKHQSRVV